MAEINHLLGVVDGELVTYTDNAMLAKVDMWLDTPKGQYWGRPEWGHRLDMFRHEPLTTSVEVQMENIIIRDLERDLPDILVTGIEVKMLDVDQFEITINTNLGQLLNRPVTL